MPKLENWSIIFYLASPYQAPEQGEQRLQGKIYNDDRFPNGKNVITSPPVKGNREEGTVTTRSGTVYLLGEVDPRYEEAYPNARERLFNSLEKLAG